MTDLFRERLQSSLGGAYTIERELGGGGMSRVFVAREDALGRDVVVKVLPPELAEGVSAERFTREIRVAAQLQQANIVPLMSAGETDGLPYYTMPFVNGESLRARLQRGPLPISEATSILRDVARALAYAHMHGVVHRDIKPENILLSGGAAVVTDFGIAKALAASSTRFPESAQPTSAGSLTVVGTSLGTPAYMAPEQAAGDAVDARTDLYAWGVVAYEMLAGRHPFAERRTLQGLIAAHLAERPVPLRSLRRDVPSALAAPVMRCLEKAPASRPASATELLHVLDAARPLDNARAMRFGRMLKIAAALLVAAVAFAGIWLAHHKVHVVPSAPAGVQSRSVAVMPFVNESGDTSDTYFSDGMTEELTDELAKVHGLAIAARSSVFALRQPRLSAVAAGRMLGVRNIVEGTVRRAGKRLRISAELVDTHTGYSLWAEHYDRDVGDVFAIQDEIARAIAGNLQIRLADHPVPHFTPTTSTEAHDLFLEARYHIARRTGRDLEQGIELLHRAIGADSSYAQAYATLAQAYALLSAYEAIPNDSLRIPALAAAERALTLDSTLAEAHAATAVTALRFDWDWIRGEREFKHAIALDSTYASAQTWYSQELDLLGEPEAAVTRMRDAMAVEPLSPITNVMSGVALYNDRRYAAAEAAERRALAIDKNFVRAHRDLGWALLAQGRSAEALREFDTSRALMRDAPGPETAYLYAITGRRREAAALANALAAEEGRHARLRAPLYGWETARPVELAFVFGALGDRNRAFAWLQSALRMRDLPMYIRTAPQFDSLRSDPRYAQFIQRLGLPR